MTLEDPSGNFKLSSCQLTLTVLSCRGRSEIRPADLRRLASVKNLLRSLHGSHPFPFNNHIPDIVVMLCRISGFNAAPNIDQHDRTRIVSVKSVKVQLKVSKS